MTQEERSGPSPGCDKYNCRLGFPGAAVNAQLDRQPKTVEEIAAASGVAAGRVREHLTFHLQPYVRKNPRRWPLSAVLVHTSDDGWHVTG